MLGALRGSGWAQGWLHEGTAGELGHGHRAGGRQCCSQARQQAELGAVCGDQGVRAGGRWRVPSAPEPISGYLWDVRCGSTFPMKLGAQLWSGEDPGVVSTDTAR